MYFRKAFDPQARIFIMLTDRKLCNNKSLQNYVLHNIDIHHADSIY